MSQLLGASRITNQIGPDPMADERLQQMLALYKTPATIRDMKQTFFYVDAISSTTQLNPLNLYYNYAGRGPQPNGFNFKVNNTYYDKLGTTRNFNIASKVHELIDIRVPKDKYVVEINLVECVIESDPTGFLSMPDRIVARVNNDGVWDQLPVYVDPPLLSGYDSSTPPRKNLINNLSEATKQVQPQTLYVKIKEMDNGEPFNWSVTNSGSYSIDKSHQLLVRHGDVNYANLTLEFGHLAFIGNDVDRLRQITDPNNNSLFQINEISQQLGINNSTPMRNEKTSYNQPKFFDYNVEYYNTLVSTNYDDEYAPDKVASFYKGDGGVEYGLVQPYDLGNNMNKIPAQNISQPESRPFAKWMAPDGGAILNGYYVQGKPYFYSQQVSKLGFRLMLRLIHLF